MPITPLSQHNLINGQAGKKPILYSELGSDAIAVCFSRKGETAWLLPAKAEREGKKKRIRTIETREAWAKGGGV